MIPPYLFRLGRVMLISLVAAISVPSLWAAKGVPAAVPGAWEEEGPAFARNHDGMAWYRAWVKVHDSFFTRHARNLYEESVSLNLRDVADAHEVYVNGVRIGAGGQFPPDFRSGRGEIHRHKVPVGTLRQGEWNEIAIRVYNESGPGGFLGEAPFIMNYFMEAVLEGAWEFSLGDTLQPGSARTDRPDSFAFDQFRESNRVLGRSAQWVTGPKLAPADSFAKMKSAADLQVDLLITEPLVAQPTHMSFDERGRLWVTQYRQYPYPAGVTMVSRDKYYRSHYDKVPPPPPNHARGADVVSIHEDSDGDGIFDRHKVFQDGLNMANAAVRGRGGVWVMHTPYLLYYPDGNFDDVPDGPPVVHLQGFGLEDTHSVANGLAWGPDGWLYGGQGSTRSSRVTRRGLDPAGTEGVYFEGCMVWRYHSETREYEIFAEGSGNTFGLEFDADGRLYSGHNGGDTRGWHYVQGGFYLMQGVEPGKFGPPRHPYAFGDLPMMRSLSPVRRFSHFGAFVEGTAMPAAYHGQLFAIDPLHNEVIAAQRLVRGATFETRDAGRPMWSEDVGFRPLFIVNAPDGSLFVSDMYEYYIAHGQHYQSQLDPDTGRIYRLRGRGLPLERDTNLAEKSTAQLIALLSHPNTWHRFTAARVLGERKDADAVTGLERVLADNSERGALGALWALQQMGRLTDRTAVTALRHPYAPVRMWAVRLLGDNYGVGRGLRLSGIGAAPSASGLPTPLMAAVSAMAESEPDAEVRSQVASTVRRLPTSQALALVTRLVTHEADVGDPYLPLLNWWVLEPHLALDRGAVLGFLAAPGLWDLPQVQQHLLPRLMRRFALEGRRQDLLVCAQLLRMAPTPGHAAYLMSGFEDAYRGRPMAGLPEELLQAMAAAGQSPLILRLRQGEQEAIQQALALVRDRKTKVNDRIFYTGVLGEVRVDNAPPLLLEIAAGTDPLPLRKAAFVALLGYDLPDIGRWAVRLLPKTTGELRLAVLALLSSRASWAGDLLQTIETGGVAAQDVPSNIVDRLRGHQAVELAARVSRVFPTAAPTAGYEQRERVTGIERILKTGTGNPYQGESIYLERCASCHILFFKGGQIGPDLTSYQRDNLGTMLSSIIDPNAEIREGYQYYSIETSDGRSLSGFIVERDSQVAVLRGLEGANITLPQTEIKAMNAVGRSLMPEGLLEGLDDQQLRDFFAYLRISQPITR
jgi:putative heme-binding domain-containing protein